MNHIHTSYHTIAFCVWVECRKYNNAIGESGYENKSVAYIHTM